MSRLPLALLLALVPSAAFAGQSAPVTAEQAIENYREVFQSTQEIDCPRSADPEEIVVCARPSHAPDPNRPPLAIPREAGARIRGEAFADGGGCIRLYHQPVMIDVVKAAKFTKRLVERLIEGE